MGECDYGFPVVLYCLPERGRGHLLRKTGNHARQSGEACLLAEWPRNAWVYVFQMGSLFFHVLLGLQDLWVDGYRHQHDLPVFPWKEVTSALLYGAIARVDRGLQQNINTKTRKPGGSGG